MGRQHTPTRVDIRTSGWTSGLDMPGTRGCAVATCHHKEHQLRGTVQEDAAALTAAFFTANALEAAEPANRGWAPPSGYDYSATKSPARSWPMLGAAEAVIFTYGWGPWKRHHVVAFAPYKVGQTGRTGIDIGSFRHLADAQHAKSQIDRFIQETYDSIKDHVTQHGWK